MGRSSKSNGTVASSTIRSMENIFERLNCLNFPGRIAKNEFLYPNEASLFNNYVAVTTFLIDMIREKEPTVTPLETEEFEDPNQIAHKFMLSLQSLDYSIDFPIAKLKQPFGDIACSILDFLSAKAVLGFSIEGPKYAEDDVDLSITEEEEGGPNRNHDVKTENEERIGIAGKVQSDAEIAEWYREIERVDPLLEIQFDSKQQEWREQIDNIVAASGNFAHDFEASELAVGRLLEVTSATHESLGSNETLIHDKMEHIVEEFNNVTVSVKMLEKSRAQSKIALEDARTELREVTKELDEAKAKVEEKCNSITDTSRLFQIKTVLQEMKAEIRIFDVDIGMLEHTLLHKRLQEGGRELGISR